MRAVRHQRGTRVRAGCDCRDWPPIICASLRSLDKNTRELRLGFALNGSCANEQYRNLAFVPDGGDRAAVQQVLKEAMTVCGHRNQIALRLLSSLEDLSGRVA